MHVVTVVLFPNLNDVIQFVCEQCFQFMYQGYVNGTVHPIADHEGPDVEQWYSSTIYLTSALGGGGWSTPSPDRFTPQERPRTLYIGGRVDPIARMDGAENLVPTGIRSTDRQAHSESLYRLRSPSLEVQKSSSECLVKYCNETPFYSIIG